MGGGQSTQSGSAKGAAENKIFLAVRRLVGRERVAPESLKEMLDVHVACSTTTADTIMLNTQCIQFQADMLANLHCGNYGALGHLISRSVEEYLAGLDPYAPSHVALANIRVLKNAILLFRIWTRFILDEKHASGLAAIIRAVEDSGETDLSDLGDVVHSLGASRNATPVPDAPPRTPLTIPCMESDVSGLSTPSCNSVFSAGEVDTVSPAFRAVCAGVLNVLQVTLVPCTRALITESVRLVTVLLSTCLHNTSDTTFIRAVNVDSEAMQRLMTNMAAIICAPAPPPAPVADSGGGLVGGLVSALASPWSLLSSFSSAAPAPAPVSTPILLSVECSLTLLALIYSQTPRRENYFLHYVSLFGDAADPDRSPVIPSLSFSTMFSVLCASTHTDAGMMLLYTFMYNNPQFLAYVVSRTSDQDILLLPILERLFIASQSTESTNVYIVLVVLLMLSQDTHFVEASFAYALKDTVAWYPDRSLHHPSAGDMWMLVAVRLLQSNMSGPRDKFTNDMCLAVMANLAPHVVRLCAHASQRLVLVFVLLARHRHRLARRYEIADAAADKTAGAAGSGAGAGPGSGAGAGSVPGSGAGSGAGSPEKAAVESSKTAGAGTASSGAAGAAGAGAGGAGSAGGDGAARLGAAAADAASGGVPALAAAVAADVAALQGQLGVVDTVLRRLLQVVNTVLACHLRHNTDLVYSVLVDKDAFAGLVSVRAFAPLIQPLQTLCAMVERKFDAASQPTASVAAVAASISQATQQLPDNRLPRPKLEHFEYEQTPDVADFFVPCTWAAILVYSPLLRQDVDYLLFRGVED